MEARDNGTQNSPLFPESVKMKDSKSILINSPFTYFKTTHHAFIRFLCRVCDDRLSLSTLVCVYDFVLRRTASPGGGAPSHRGQRWRDAAFRGQHVTWHNSCFVGTCVCICTYACTCVFGDTKQMNIYLSVLKEKSPSDTLTLSYHQFVMSTSS